MSWDYVKPIYEYTNMTMSRDDDARMMTHLNHADLTVGDTNQTLVDETIVVGVTWLALHDVTLGLLVSQRDSGYLSQTKIQSFNFDIC